MKNWFYSSTRQYRHNCDVDCFVIGLDINSIIINEDNKMKTIKLTDPEISCIYSLVIERQREGSYSGSKKQYYERIESILNKLEKAYNEDKNETHN